jgi:hypothetical protein
MYGEGDDDGRDKQTGSAIWSQSQGKEGIRVCSHMSPFIDKGYSL